MKKQEVLDLLSGLPDELDADQLLYTLPLKHRLARAEADLTAGRRTPDSERAVLLGTEYPRWESERARYRRREQVLTRLLNNRELMDQVFDGIERIKRGERGTPFREILAKERQKHEG